MDLELLDAHARRRRRARLPRPPGVALGRARRGRLRRDDRPARARCASACAAEVPVLDARRSRDEAHARDGTVKALFHTARRAPGRGGADALPRRPPLGLRLLAVGLPADLHVLRDRRDEVRPQPDRLGDPRPGAALPPHRAAQPPRVHGHGRADDEPRQRARRRARLPDLGITHRRTGISTVGWVPGIRAADRVRHADPARALAARAGGRAALADHAGQRALPDRRGARRPARPTTSAAAARSSSST